MEVAIGTHSGNGSIIIIIMVCVPIVSWRHTQWKWNYYYYGLYCIVPVSSSQVAALLHCCSACYTSAPICFWVN